MSIFDHHKQWAFDTNADTAECIVAFREALTKRSVSAAFKMTGRWDVNQRSEASACATYTGRGGLIRGITPISQGASWEQDAARGSELSFEVVRSKEQPGRALCALWLSHRSIVRVGFIPFTADARFIRGSMHQVAHRLRALDPNLVLVKT